MTFFFKACPSVHLKKVQDPLIVREKNCFSIKQNMSNINIFFTVFFLTKAQNLDSCVPLCVCVYAIAEINQDNKEEQFWKGR